MRTFRSSLTELFRVNFVRCAFGAHFPNVNWNYEFSAGSDVQNPVPLMNLAQIVFDRERELEGFNVGHNIRDVLVRGRVCGHGGVE